MMKRMLVPLFILLFTLSLSAQENDSILLEEVKSLKKELGLQKKKTKSLQSKIYKLQKTLEEAIKEAEQAFTETDEAMEKNSARSSELEQVLKASEEKALESRTTMADWTKKMMMILALVSLLFFIVLLVLVITNRKRIDRDYQKLEVKVDNTKEALGLEIRSAMNKHEEDHKALKAEIEKGKK